MITVPKSEMFDCDIKPRPLRYSLSDYHRAISEGPLHYEWEDKPHRLVYDLIAAVRFYAEQSEPMQAEPLEVVMEPMHFEDGRKGWYLRHPEFYCDIEPDSTGN